MVSVTPSGADSAASSASWRLIEAARRLPTRMRISVDMELAFRGEIDTQLNRTAVRLIPVPVTVRLWTTTVR